VTFIEIKISDEVDTMSSLLRRKEVADRAKRLSMAL